MNEQEIFSAALEQNSQDRPAFLDSACGDDVALRQRIERLLNLAADRGSFLQKPAPEVLATEVPKVAEQPGTIIGPYKLREQIGEGGFGVVYVAEQHKPVARKVALKIIKPGMDTKEVIARFEAERQALALMDHPNVARVLDAGATESGRPYFVMELVRGVSITEFCDERKLSIRERLSLLVDVCRAVQHAHQKGIIHRDLKPSNVMVTLADGKPIVKVIDFGVSKALSQKLTELTIYTAYGQMVGTPMYMSPEQAEMTLHDVDTRSDVYALGVLLYELLSGTTPFDRETLQKSGFEEMRRIIREVEPPRPSVRVSTLRAQDLTTASGRRGIAPTKLSASLSGELDWIVMKALEKDRNRRYESASAFADDLERYLNDEPVQACPPSAAYRFHKFVHRNSALFTTATMVALLVLLASGVSIWQSHNLAVAHKDTLDALDTAQAARDDALQNASEAKRQRDAARFNLYLAEMRLAHQDWKSGQIARLQETLTRHIPRAGQADLRGWEWNYLNSLCNRDLFTLRGHQSAVRVATSPDGYLFASGDSDGILNIWNVETGELVVSRQTGEGSVRSLAWSPDGEQLATCGNDGMLRIWSRSNFNESRSIRSQDDALYCVAWSPNGDRLATSGSGVTLTVWNAETGEIERVLNRHAFGPVYAVAWSPDGERLASGGNDRVVRIWEVATGRELKILSFEDFVHDVFTVTWSPDGERLAAGTYQQIARVWDTESWEEIATMTHRGGVEQLRWHPDGRWLAAATRSQRVSVWNVDLGEEVRSFQGHTGWVYSVDWSHGGRRLVSASKDRTIKVWDLDLDPECVSLAETNGKRISWSPTGDRFATVAEGWVDVWHLSDASKFQSLAGSSCAWSPDAELLAVYGNDEQVTIWNATTWDAIRTFPVGGISDWNGMAWSPVSDDLLIAGDKGGLSIWLAEQGKKTATISTDSRSRGVDSSPYGRRLMMQQWSHDGREIAASGLDGDIKIWSLASPSAAPRIIDWPEETVWTGDVAWNSDGTQLVSGGWDQTVRVFDVATGKEKLAMRGHSGAVRTVCWSPDGRRIASAGFDGSVKLWDAATGNEILTLDAFLGGVQLVRWSPDGEWLAAIGVGGLKLWNASQDSSTVRSLIQQNDLLVAGRSQRAVDRAGSGSADNAVEHDVERPHRP